MGDKEIGKNISRNHSDPQRWSKYYEANKDFSLTTRRLLSFILIKSKLQGKAFVIDLGSGTGQLSRELLHRGFKKVSGVDISEVGVKLAQEATVLSGLNYYVHDLEGDFKELFTEKADLIITRHTFAFIENRSYFLEQVVSLLNNCGVFVIISPSEKFLPREKKGIDININETVKLLKSYFKEINHYEYDQDDIFICKN